MNIAAVSSLYNIANNTVASSSASQLVYAASDQYFSPSDLSIFQTRYNIPVNPVTSSVGMHASNAKCAADMNSCVEGRGCNMLLICNASNDFCTVHVAGNLDVEYIMGMAQGARTTFWYDSSTDAFITWLIQMDSLDPVPLVMSISYGLSEIDLDFQTVNQFDVEAVKLVNKGVTIVASSGDTGAVRNEATYTRTQCVYTASFPATSMYVVAVGATSGPESGIPETTSQADSTSVITSGGGFSRYTPRPSFQSDSINNYFAYTRANPDQAPVAGYGSGRGVPDIALVGNYFETIIDYRLVYLSGTSVSAPMFAGMVTLINGHLLEAGKPSLGWLTPLLYASFGNYTNDIRTGNNKCTTYVNSSWSTICCSQGFYAAPGWDPTTGFGSIDFRKMLLFFANITGVINLIRSC
jgi:subtilase family serine protease